MSAFTLFTAALACLAPLASAYTQPSGTDPVGNPFSAPGLGSTVPVGQSFTVQWTPTTSGTVTLVLLKGPANQLAVVGPIAQSIDNSGSFAWTPSSDLTEGPTSTTGYGLQLIVDSNGQYQYTTQFGISNPASGGSSNASNSSTSAAGSSVVVVVSSSAPTDSANASAPMTTMPASTTVGSAMSTTSIDSSAVVVTLPTNSATTLITAPATGSMAVSTVSRSTTARSTGAVASASSTGGAAQATAGFIGFAALAGAAMLAI